MLAFDAFVLDVDGRALWRGGERVPLTPKVLDLLILLVERRGTVVTKDEILKAVWPGVVVEEGGLARNVSLLRKALGDDDGHRCIATLPRRGYQFIAPVTEVAGPAEGPARAGAPAAAPAPRPGRGPAIAAAVLAAVALLAGLAVLVRSPGRDPGAAASGWTSRALTSNAPTRGIVGAALSPDGRTLAWAELDGVYVRGLDAVSARRIALPSELVPTQLEWWPDGSRLVVSAYDESRRHHAAWTVDVAGAHAERWLDEADFATVAPDGRTVAFVRRTRELWLAPTAGGEPRPFAVLAPDRNAGVRLQFSRDGAYLLVGSQPLLTESGPSRIEARRVADGAVVPLVETPSAMILDFQAVGGELVWTELAPTGGSTLEAATVDLARGTVGARRRLAAWPDALAFGLGAAADGRRFTLIRDPAQSDVYVGDVGADPAALTNVRRLTLDEATDRPTGWTPDGREVLFHSDRGGRFRAYAQALDASDARLLVEADEEIVRPLATADGKWLVYEARHGRDERPDLTVDFVRRPWAGGAPTVLDRRNLLRRSLRCAAHANRCVIADVEATGTVFRELDPGSGAARELLRLAELHDSPFAWDLSPDGTRLATILPESPRSRIVVTPLAPLAPGAPATLVSVDGLQGLRSVRFDAPGTGFYVSSSDGAAGALAHVDAAGRARFIRRQFNDSGWAIPSPDGKHLAIQESTEAGNVLLFERGGR
jgi:DNA-binding winged helix-turn-helix (wHTH) protein